MAKKVSTINVSGLTTQDILNMDVTHLNDTDLRKITNRLLSATNKRIRRLNKADVNVLNQKEYSIKGLKNRNQVLKTFSDMRKFMNKKTSSVTGVKSLDKTINNRLGTKLSHNDLKQYWENYRKLVELDKAYLSGNYDSKQLQKESAELYESGKINDGNFYDILHEKLKDEYESEMMEEESNDVFDYDYTDNGNVI